MPVVAPFEHTSAGWTGAIDGFQGADDAECFLMRDDEMVGTVTPDAAGRVVIAAAEEDEQTVLSSEFRVIVGDIQTLERPFTHERGRMWSKWLPEFTGLGATMTSDRQSPLVVLEDGHRLRLPHAPHDLIDQRGGGRYSHWESTLFLSTLDGSDPNTNGRVYRIIVPLQERPPAGVLKGTLEFLP
jgi:hypothetical protein